MIKKNRQLKFSIWGCIEEHKALPDQVVNYVLQQDPTDHVRIILPTDLFAKIPTVLFDEFMAPDYGENQNGERFLSPAESLVAMQLNSTLTFCQALLLAVTDFSLVHFGDALWIHPEKEEIFLLPTNPNFEPKFNLSQKISKEGMDIFWPILSKIVDDILDQFENENFVEIILILPESLNPWSLLWWDFLILLQERSTAEPELPKELAKINLLFELFLLDQSVDKIIPPYLHPLLPHIKTLPDTFHNKK